MSPAARTDTGAERLARLMGEFELGVRIEDAPTDSFRTLLEQSAQQEPTDVVAFDVGKNGQVDGAGYRTLLELRGCAHVNKSWR